MKISSFEHNNLALTCLRTGIPLHGPYARRPGYQTKNFCFNYLC